MPQNNLWAGSFPSAQLGAVHPLRMAALCPHHTQVLKQNDKAKFWFFFFFSIKMQCGELVLARLYQWSRRMRLEAQGDMCDVCFFFVKSFLSALCSGWRKVGSDVQHWDEGTSWEKAVVPECKRRDKSQSLFRWFRAGFSERWNALPWPEAPAWHHRPQKFCFKMPRIG